MKKYFMIIFCLTLSLNFGQTFTLKSNELGGQALKKQVFNSFGCNGENISPQLYWENPPAETESFAVTIYDKDAPTGSGWWHWLIFDIPKNVLELKSDAGNVNSNTAPEGSLQSKTDFGTYGYGGPCPPEGDSFHTYKVTVYALKTAKLGLDKDASPVMVGFNINNNTIEKASLIFYYKR